MSASHQEGQKRCLCGMESRMEDCVDCLEIEVKIAEIRTKEAKDKAEKSGLAARVQREKAVRLMRAAEKAQVRAEMKERSFEAAREVVRQAETAVLRVQEELEEIKRAHKHGGDF